MPITLIDSFPKEKREARNDGSAILHVAENFMDTLQGENFVGVPSTFLRLQGCTLNCVWCFHENTKIQTSLNGKKKIKDIKSGDKLITLDEKKNIVETTVKKVMKRKIDIKESILKIIVNNKKDNPLIVTKEHPIYIKNKGWTKAKNIKKNDIIIGIENTQLISYKMKNYNPMKNEKIKNKCVNTLKYKREIGEIIPYERTKENKLIQRKYKLGAKNPMKNPEVARKNALNHFKKKSRLEIKYEQLFYKLKLPITYIGNNKLAIGNKQDRYRFPDFIVDGKKKLIEVYDTTFPWYSKYGCRTKDTYEKARTKHYNKFGYDVIFLTEKELMNTEKLQKTLFNYIFNGYIVTDVTNKITNKSYARLFGNLKTTETDVYNLSCEPYNTYLANQMWVHNCDTAEVWRQGNPYSVDEILEMWDQAGLLYKFEEGQHLILTGGSPLKQQDASIELITKVKEISPKTIVEIENECVLMPKQEMIDLVDIWNNSPKLKNSGMNELVRYKPEVIKKVSSLENSWFKFVITSEEDWQEIKKDFLDTGLIKKEQIVIMPEGQTREELQKHYDIAVNISVRENVRFTDRLHVTIWNKKTGV